MAWAMAQHPVMCKTPVEADNCLRKVQRWSAYLDGTTPGKGASSQAMRLPGAGVSGVCTTMVPPTRRKRRMGTGGPGSMKCPELGSELFGWFVDSLKNVRGQLPFLACDGEGVWSCSGPRDAGASCDQHLMAPAMAAPPWHFLAHG